MVKGLKVIDKIGSDKFTNFKQNISIFLQRKINFDFT